MIGIYKITSPLGRVYIGQSIRIEIRFNYYKRLDCKSQPRLYNSLLKYGYDKHTFEVIEECSTEMLNIRERYWQEFYNVLSCKKGLNCNFVKTNDLSGKQSKYTVEKRINSCTGKKRTKEVCERIRELNNLGIIGMLGKKHSQKTKDKIKSSHKRPMSGKTHSDEYKKWITDNMSKTILDKETGVFYNGCKEICEIYGFNIQTLRGRLNGNLNQLEALRLDTSLDSVTSAWQMPRTQCAVYLLTL